MSNERKRILLTAVLHADPIKMKEAGVVGPHAAPKLELARELQALINEDPDSPLAREVARLLDQERLFQMVGPWPPTQSSKPSDPASPRCRHCGKANP